MKCAIVKLSAIVKYDRLDAGFFLGLVNGERPQDLVNKAVAGLKLAENRLDLVLQRKTEAEQVAAELIASGEVVPIGGRDD